MRFAQRVFLFSGLYGLVAMPPMYFLERQLGRDYPPPITHPEFYYGFIGVVLAWQVAFLVIAYDPQRYRALMVPAMLEKFTYVFACASLLMSGRQVAGFVPPTALIDLILGSLFVVAFYKTREID